MSSAVLSFRRFNNCNILEFPITILPLVIQYFNIHINTKIRYSIVTVIGKTEAHNPAFLKAIQIFKQYSNKNALVKIIVKYLIQI